MTDPRPLSLSEAREKYTELRKRRLHAVNEYEVALHRAADSKQTYREAKAKAHVLAATEGGTAEQKKVRADALAADAERALGYADAGAKVAKERIDAVEADRAMLNAFITWSKDLNKRGVE